MSKPKDHTVETVEKRGRKAIWRKWLQAQWIVKHVPFVLFLALLAVVYIGNGHVALNTMRDLSRAERELKLLQYRYRTVKADVMFRTKETEIVKAAQALGLTRNTEPPILLKDSASSTNN
jgi:hypothetical protein